MATLDAHPDTSPGSDPVETDGLKAAPTASPEVVESPTPMAVHLAGVIVVASVVAVDPGGWYPFVVAKWSAVAIATVAAWTMLGRTSRSSLPRPVVVAFGSLLAVLALAATFGRDPLYAWTGTPERHLGVVSWVLFAMALTVGAVLDNPGRRRVFARWVVVALGWAVLYGGAEFFGWDPIATGANTSRIGGPYGSASLFGAALCLLIPVAFGLAADIDEHRWWRWSAVIAGTLGVATVAVTGTRAAWVGLTVATAMLIIADLGRRSWRRPSWGGPSWGVIAGMVVGIVVGVAGVVSRSGVIERSAGGSSRLAEWGVGWRIVTAHPWLGVGPEGYRTALADGVTASYEQTYGRTVIPDRAHNALIDVAAAGGFGALALYALIVAIVLFAAWRVARSRRSAVATGIAVATVAYATQQMFLFPVATIDPIFWLLAGSTLVTAWPSRPLVPTRGQRSWRLAGGALVIAALFANGVVALAADRAARDAVVADDLSAAEQAVRLRPDVVRYQLLAVSLEPNTIAGHQAAIAHAGQALDVSPNDPFVRQTYGDTVLRLAISTGDTADIDRAVAVWQRLFDNDVNCYRCALALGYAAALDSNTDLAIEAFTRATALAPSGDNEAQSALDSLQSSRQPPHESSPDSSQKPSQQGTDGDG